MWLHHPCRSMGVDEHGYKEVKTLLPKKPYYGKTYLRRRGKTRVRIVTDRQNFALCEHCMQDIP